jgi:hypothetical protein
MRRRTEYNFSDQKRDEDTYIKVNIKVKLSLYLTNHHAIEKYWGVEV